MGKIHYTAKDERKSTEFLTRAVKAASSQLDCASYDAVVTDMTREQIKPKLSSAANDGNAMQCDSVEPTASVTKKQKVEKTQVPAQISNSKLIDEDPNKLNGVQMKGMYTVAPVQQMSGYVPLHKRTRQQ